MITCQGCNDWVLDLNTSAETEARARFLGWRVFDGTSAGGTPLKASWCPQCFEKGIPVRSRKLVPQQDGQLTFDDLLGEEDAHAT